VREVYRIELESGECAIIGLGRKSSLPLNGPVGFDGGLAKKRRSIDAERAVTGKKKAPPDETATP